MHSSYMFCSLTASTFTLCSPLPPPAAVPSAICLSDTRIVQQISVGRRQRPASMGQRRLGACTPGGHSGSPRMSGQVGCMFNIGCMCDLVLCLGDLSDQPFRKARQAVQPQPHAFEHDGIQNVLHSVGGRGQVGKVL